MTVACSVLRVKSCQLAVVEFTTKEKFIIKKRRVALEEDCLKGKNGNGLQTHTGFTKQNLGRNVKMF